MNCLLIDISALHMDLVTGIALITLLFMMLQTEHERCDRVRAGWREVRRATFATTSAFQWAKKMEGQPDSAKYLEKARQSLQELYSTILLYGKGSLREEYRKRINEEMKANNNSMYLLPLFGSLDGKTERKFDTWRLRIL
jgi:hypothetical protein